MSKAKELIHLFENIEVQLYIEDTNTFVDPLNIEENKVVSELITNNLSFGFFLVDLRGVGIILVGQKLDGKDMFGSYGIRQTDQTYLKPSTPLDGDMDDNAYGRVRVLKVADSLDEVKIFPSGSYKLYILTNNIGNTYVGKDKDNLII